MPNLAASCTSAVADHAFLAEPLGSASASLSFLASFAFRLATTELAFGFAFSAFPCTTFEVGTEEATAELPLLQKLPYLAVVRANGNRGVFVEDAVCWDIFSYVNAVWVVEGFLEFPIFVVEIVEGFGKQE